MTALLALTLVLWGALEVAASSDAGEVLRGLRAAETDNVYPTSFRRRSGTSAHSSLVTNRGTHQCSLRQRFEEGFKRTGTVMRQEYLSTPPSCARMCAVGVVGCQAVNYEIGPQICYFLSEPGYVISQPGFISVPVSLASFINWCLPPNFILGHKQVSKPMANTPFVSTSAQDCCISCFTTPDCIAFDYNVSTQDCVLSASTGKISSHDNTITGLVCVD